VFAGAGASEGGGGASAIHSEEASGADPAGFDAGGVGDPRSEGGGGTSTGSRPGDWNPGEQSGGGELY
jgi:hypothetical protein